MVVLLGSARPRLSTKRIEIERPGSGIDDRARADHSPCLDMKMRGGCAAMKRAGVCNARRASLFTKNWRIGPEQLRTARLGEATGEPCCLSSTYQFRLGLKNAHSLGCSGKRVPRHHYSYAFT